MNHKIFILTLLLLLLFDVNIPAQNITLFGTCRKGGNYYSYENVSFSGGTIFQYFPANDSLVRVYEFDSVNGYAPSGRLTQATDGKIYGLTVGGGANEDGVLYQYDPVAMQYNKKYDFDSSDASPSGGLIQFGNKLYGLNNGGPGNVGEIYSYDLTADTVTDEYDFIINGPGGITGEDPHGDLTLFNNNFYGVTWYGGANDDGVIFQYNPSNQVYTKIFDFDYFVYGASPTGKITVANNGNLYCVTSGGGANETGTLLEYDPDSNTVVKKLDFDSTLIPTGSLLLASDGNLYGFADSAKSPTQASSTGGVIFEYTPGASSITIKYVLSSNTNVNAPGANLIQASNGLLYCADNTVYSFNYTTNAYQTYAAFNDSLGIDPFDGLLEVNILLGIENVKATDNLSLYPNPATNEVTIQNISVTPTTIVKIMDVTGRTLISDYTSLSDKIILDTHTLPPGMYMVKLKQDNLNYTGRFVKMN